MRLVRFNHISEPPTAARLGLVVADTLVADVVVAAARYYVEVKSDPLGRELAEVRFPGYVAELLRCGVPSLDGLHNINTWLETIASADGAALGVDGGRIFTPIGECRLHVSVRPGKLVVLNGPFSEFTEAMKRPSTSGPYCWLKATTSAIGPRRPIEKPWAVNGISGRCELGIVIGQKVRNLTPHDAMKAVAGYTVVCNAIASNGKEHRAGNLSAFTADATTPIGPWLITRDQIANIEAAEMTTIVNGERRLTIGIAEIGWRIAEIVAFASQITLDPGDIISIGGTEASTDGASELGDYVNFRVNDKVECLITGIGGTQNEIVAAPDPKLR